jgi:hypothetical protein
MKLHFSETISLVKSKMIQTFFEGEEVKDEQEKNRRKRRTN